MFSKVEELLSPAKGVIKTLFWGAAALGIIYFAYNAAKYAVLYFNSENERDKLDCRNNIKTNLLGIFFMISVGVIINVVLGLFGLDGIISF